MISMRDFPPIHPGEQLREEFLKPLKITAYRLAKDISVPVTRIQDIVAAWRAISARRPSSGSTCSGITIWRSRPRRSVAG
jgi:hypothetical protein